MRSAARLSVMLAHLLSAERLSLRTYMTAGGLTGETSCPRLVSKQSYKWVSCGPNWACFDGGPCSIYFGSEMGLRRMWRAAAGVRAAIDLHWPVSDGPSHGDGGRETVREARLRTGAGITKP